MRLNRKVALVTGAGSGIGRSIAVLAAHEGADVIVNGRDAAKLEETASLVRAAGRRAHVAPVDVTDHAGIAAMVEEVVAAFGRIDILVHNAGISGVVPFTEMSLETFDAMVQNHLYGLFNTTRAVVPHMVEQRYGRIVVVASASAIKGDAQLVHYDAAKAGQIGLVRGLARELVREGVTVNVVAPGLTMTPILASVNEEIIKAYTPPIGFIADPEDQAWPVIFLASDEARYITGQVLIPDGGAS
jgi:3-oxoacyl-[acyl-carrier protein] reductase